MDTWRIIKCFLFFCWLPTQSLLIKSIAQIAFIRKLGGTRLILVILVQVRMCISWLETPEGQGEQDTWSRRMDKDSGRKWS